MRLSQVLLVAFAAACGNAAHGQGRPWSIDAKPALILGSVNSDVLFGAGLIGALKLPDGNILVGDRGDYSLKVFDARGALVKSLGRNGAGPGEMNRLAHIWRCGNQIIAYDISNGYRVTVFSTDMTWARSFRFGSAGEGGNTPYTGASSCNGTGTFVHHGWEARKDMKSGAFRAQVPLWLSGPDSTVRPIGTIAGSERWGRFNKDGNGGTGPLPLGKQPVIAIGRDRIYTGTAETYTITMRDLTGKVIGTFGKPSAQLAATKADIDLAVEDEAAGRDDAVRERVRKSYETMELPKTIPAYKAMLVDSEGMIWIRDYRRASPTQAQWTVFTHDGRQVAEVQLPLYLTVSEIGRDYVLGKYIDPVEDIPEIRMYQLRR
jgi:hypothetical protein